MLGLFQRGVTRRRGVQRSVEARVCELPGGPEPYCLKRSSARRTLALRVSEQGELIVNAPQRALLTRIESFIRQHADWIARQRARYMPGAAAVPVNSAQRQRWRAEAAEKLPRRLAELAAQMGVSPPPMMLSDARTRWGSLSANGRMRLNWRLVMLPPELIDYVICHELAHLRQPNHSPAFWREVAALYPAYPAARRALRAHAAACFQY